MEELEPPVILPELVSFLRGVGLSQEHLEWCVAGEMPERARGLLAHERDMTSALERHHGEPMTLEVRRTLNEDDRYFREVILRGDESGKPVEYGAIEIMLDGFPEGVRKEIVGGRMPLGGILNRHGYPYRSAPRGYFRIPGESLRAIFPDAPGGETSFGRYNELLSDEGECLALIIEILPPIKT